jgi:hypothetical protein
MFSSSVVLASAPQATRVAAGGFMDKVGAAAKRVGEAIARVAKQAWAYVLAFANLVKAAYIKNPQMFWIAGGALAVGAAIMAIFCKCCSKKSETVEDKDVLAKKAAEEAATEAARKSQVADSTTTTTTTVVTDSAAVAPTVASVPVTSQAPVSAPSYAPAPAPFGYAPAPYAYAPAPYAHQQQDFMAVPADCSVRTITRPDGRREAIIIKNNAS